MRRELSIPLKAIISPADGDGVLEVQTIHAVDRENGIVYYMDTIEDDEDETTEQDIEVDLYYIDIILLNPVTEKIDDDLYLEYISPK